MTRQYTNETEWEKTKWIRWGLCIFTSILFVVMVIGALAIILKDHDAGAYAITTGAILHLLIGIPLRKIIKKRIGWTGDYFAPLI